MPKLPKINSRNNYTNIRRCIYITYISTQNLPPDTPVDWASPEILFYILCMWRRVAKK